MSTGRLLLVRHGQTGGNRHRYVGWEDEPLDDVGVEQARAVAALLREVPIDAVYASPLSRALDTARPLAEQRGLAIRVREEMKEIDYGRYQGMLKNEQPFKLRREHQYAAMPGGESLFDVYRRIGRLCEELRGEIGAGRTLAAFGHYWSNRILVGALSGVPFEEILTSRQYKPANGSVYEMMFRLPPLVIESARWVANEGAGEDN